MRTAMKTACELLTAAGVCLLLLGGCALGGAAGTRGPDSAPETEPVPVTCAEAPDHTHAGPEGTNVLEHEPGGYCGNTITTVRARDGGWEKSFWGSDSVSMTDLLRFLDYSGEVCRCAPEYTVDTEFGGGYDLNLTEGFARCGDGQTDLTAEQIGTLRRIIAQIDKQPRA